MHGLNPGGADEDLERRPRLGQLRHRARVEFERQIVPRITVGVTDVVVGPQRGAHQGEQAAQDAIGVQPSYPVDHPGDLHRQLVVPDVSGGGIQRRIETCLEQADQRSGDAAVREQHFLDVGLAVAALGLPQVADVAAQHRYLAPVQPGAQHQGIETVHLAGAAPAGHERLAEPSRHVLGGLTGQLFQQRGLQPQPEIVDPAVHPIAADYLVGPLVDDLDIQLL
jgi:hypothetical protein